MIFATAFVLASALVASAANINVIVGDQNGLVFNPTSVIAQLNDTVSFQFTSKNHSVTQSTFASPCSPMAGGVDSGFQAVAPGSSTNPSWSITVNDPKTPLWFHCAQKAPVNHCQKGMVFAVNPTPEKSFAAFQAAAKSSANGTASSPAAGGTASPPAAGDAPPATGAGSPSPSPSGGGVIPGATAGAGSPPDSGATATSSGAAAGSTAAPNGAIASRGLSAAGVVSLIAAVAALML